MKEVVILINTLHIKNVGIIDEISIDLNNGFNVLTGETGAGKTLIIGSLENLPPAKISEEPIIRVFPAPVSPVNTLNPLFKSILISSIIPTFFICNVFINITTSTKCILYEHLFFVNIFYNKKDSKYS